MTRGIHCPSGQRRGSRANFAPEVLATVSRDGPRVRRYPRRVTKSLFAMAIPERHEYVIFDVIPGEKLLVEAIRFPRISLFDVHT